MQMSTPGFIKEERETSPFPQEEDMFVSADLIFLCSTEYKRGSSWEFKRRRMAYFSVSPPPLSLPASLKLLHNFVFPLLCYIVYISFSHFISSHISISRRAIAAPSFILAFVVS